MRGIDWLLSYYLFVYAVIVSIAIQVGRRYTKAIRGLIIMGRFKKNKSPYGQHDDAASDSVSELSIDDSASITSNISKSSAFRSKFLRGKKNKGGAAAPQSPSANGTASVGSTSKKSRGASTATGGNKSKTTASVPSPGASRSVDDTTRSVGSTSASQSRAGGGASTSANDTKRLMKDAKSRFNIGLVYLKTGDYAKAQDNLEHSLYCHIQLSGHDAKAYSNPTLFAIAGVREKLGDCYLANSAIVDKCLALDHYEESRRLLKSIDPEDAPDNVNEMLDRVNEKLKSPELCGKETRRRPPSSQTTNKYQMEGNTKAKTLLGVGVAGAGAGAVAATAAASGDKSGAAQARTAGKASKRHPASGINQVFEKLGAGIHEIANDIKEGVKDVFESSSDEGDSSLRGSLSGDEAEGFDIAMSHLERDNHRTALNYLMSLKEGGSMQNPSFRAEMALSMLKVADSALDAGKIGVATDTYEEAYAVLKEEEIKGKAASVRNRASIGTLSPPPPSDEMKMALKGCVKCHKLLAAETESIMAYGSAIEHRTRVYQLLDENNRCIPACQQLIKIAYLYGEKDDYAKSLVTLSDAVRRLFKGVNSLDMMPADRLDLLIQCYHMRAICFSKSKKWNEALDQYNELLPLIAKTEGQGGRDYNSALIQKSALLVTMGNHRLASTTVSKYLQLSELSGEMAGEMIVDDLDHILALDTAAATHLKLGNVDKAQAIFEKKLAFVKTLPNNEEMKSDTMHKLGCILAYKKQHKSALPLLNEALDTRKFLFDGKNVSVFESTWAVAAASHTLGDTDRALKEYGTLLEKMNQNKMNDSPVDFVLIHNSAGKLFFDEGKIDKSVHSFRQALSGSETHHNPELKAELTLNLANALSARGEAEKAMELYNKLLSTKSLKRTKMFFLTLFNKSLLLIKMGEVEEAKEILHKVADTRSSMADDVRGNIYLTLGNLSVSEGKLKEGLSYFEESLDAVEDGDVNSLAQVKRNIGNAYFESGQSDKAIATFEDVLEDLSDPGVEGKAVNLLKAEIWNCMSRVYKKKGDLPQAKNFAKLGEY